MPNPLFENQYRIMLVPHLFQRISHPQFGIYKRANKRSVVTTLVLEDLPNGYILMFLKDSYNCISLVYLLNFLSNLHIPPWLGKTFKFVVLRLLENAIASQKSESSHIYSWYPSKTLPQVLIITPRREITNYQQAAFFQKPLSHFVQKQF